MSRLFYHVMQDNAGNLLFDVSGTMRLAGTGTAATIYGDAALTIPIANPMTNHPSFGSFKCYLGAGTYDFYMAKAGYTFETLTGVQGLGAMAQQDASAVAITGGTISGLTSLGVNGVPGGDVKALITYNPYVEAVALRLLSGAAVDSAALQFMHAPSTQVGTITLSATATAYNTTSDVRLKHAVEDLTGELALMQALRPVSFLWKADDTPGVGFLASEVAQHVAGVITGEPDAVDAEGNILPQMIDYSKLVPFLVGAIKTLTARLVVLEDALGV